MNGRRTRETWLGMYGLANRLRKENRVAFLTVPPAT